MRVPFHGHFLTCLYPFHRPRCIARGCNSREPTYVLEGEQIPKYCSAHRGEGMVDMRALKRYRPRQPSSGLGVTLLCFALRYICSEPGALKTRCHCKVEPPILSVARYSFEDRRTEACQKISYFEMLSRNAEDRPFCDLPGRKARLQTRGSLPGLLLTSRIGISSIRIDQHRTTRPSVRCTAKKVLVGDPTARHPPLSVMRQRKVQRFAP